MDLIIVQLGTNDCKSEYHDTALKIALNCELLLNKIQELTNAKIMLISPAIIKKNNKITKKYYVGAQSKSESLDVLYQKIAKKNGFLFLSGKDLEIGEDGEHLTKIGHLQLREKVMCSFN